MDKRIFWIGTGILLIVVLAAATALILQRTGQTLHGSVINPPAPAADFTLTNQVDQNIRLSDFRGKYVLIFFGFTHCTTECPATMAILAKTLSLLGSQSAKVQVLFISTDPANDTPQAVGQFLKRFDPTFVGVTGTRDQLQPVWSAYGVTVLDNGETHSSYTYVVDPKGNLIMTYDYPGNPTDIASDLRLLLGRG